MDREGSLTGSRRFVLPRPGVFGWVVGEGDPAAVALEGPRKRSQVMSDSVRLDQTDQWRALRRHYEETRDQHLRELFAADPERGSRYTLEAGDLYVDYSRNRVTGETLRLLRELAAA